MIPALSIPNSNENKPKPEEFEMTVSPVQSLATPAQLHAMPTQPLPSATTPGSGASSISSVDSSSSPQRTAAEVQTPGGSGLIEVVPPQPPVVQPNQEFWDEKICLEVEYNPDHSLPESTATATPIGGAGVIGGVPAQMTAAAPVAETPPVVYGLPAGPGKSAAAPSDVKTAGLRRSPSSASSMVEPAPAYKSYSEVEISNMASTYRGEAGVTQDDMLKPMDRPFIFGYPRKLVMMVGGALLLVVLLIIAISVGVTAGKAGKGTQSDNDVAKMNILDNTFMSSMNWTEPSGVTHSAVVYQARDSSIMLTTRDSLSNVWRTVNVTKEVIKASNLAGLDVLTGSALAAVSNNNQHGIYYLNSRRQIQELFSLSPTASEWNAGIMGGKIKATVQPGSRISSTRHLCENCTQSLFVTWQEEGTNDIRLANFTKGDWADAGVVSQTAAPGTGLAMSVFTDFRGTGPTGAEATALRIYDASGSNLVELLNGPLTSNNWAPGNFDKPLASGLTVNPSPEIASITYGANGWFNNLVSYTDPKGQLMSAIWRGDTWSIQPSTVNGFDGGKSDIKNTQFTRLASTQAMTLYALADGRIHEFRSTASNPFLWTWDGVVFAS